MENYQFKTNIMCNNCVAKVTPVLAKHPEIVHWEVDLTSPERKLSVQTDSLSMEAVRDIVAEAGYKAESLS
ncbi:MAG: heavy-metal-associated domain-containing protein [Bacteroidota bacterium]|nr:heavy-metal-associated domain-containing protein [Bacteroidota bacterium]